MSSELSGKRVAILVANEGVEQVELEKPRQAMKDAGAETTLIAPESDDIQAVHGDIHLADTFTPDRALADVDASDFDALLLPGGVASPDKLRTRPEAVAFVRSFAEAGKPVAAICHGPWTLVEADVVRGKALTSWPSLRTDIRNAGGQWQDEQALTCPEAGYTLVTSRKPDDLEAFAAAAVAAFRA
jgi:protease I